MGFDLEEDEELEVREEKSTPRTRTKRTKELLEENTKKLEELQGVHASLEEEIGSVQSEAKSIGDRDVVGLEINHDKFGVGKITARDGKYIDVEFSDVTKKFVLPGAIADGFLKITDDDLLDYFKKYNDVNNRLIKAQVALKSNEFAAERIRDEIDKLNEKS